MSGEDIEKSKNLQYRAAAIYDFCKKYPKVFAAYDLLGRASELYAEDRKLRGVE